MDQQISSVKTQYFSDSNETGLSRVHNEEFPDLLEEFSNLLKEFSYLLEEFSYLLEGYFLPTRRVFLPTKRVFLPTRRGDPLLVATHSPGKLVDLNTQANAPSSWAIVFSTS